MEHLSDEHLVTLASIADKFSVAKGDTSLLEDLEGLELIASGSGRAVYKYNGLAIKYPLNPLGVEQSALEHRISLQDNSIRLCPILLLHKNILLQPFVETLEYDDPWESIIGWLTRHNYPHAKLMEIGLEMKRLCDEHHLDQGDLEKVSSWGLLDGRYVCIDFGFSKEMYSQRHFSEDAEGINVIE